MSGSERPDRRGLRLIRGGKDQADQPTGPRVVAAPEDSPPFALEAMVTEDDTFFVLGANPQLELKPEHPVRVWTAVRDQQPAPPGSVHVRRGTPLRLHAVVHDVSLDPTWTEEWVLEALTEVFALAREHGFRTLGLPILGAVHGQMEVGRFLEMLREALALEVPLQLERIWLVTPTGRPELLERIRDLSGAEPPGDRSD